MKRTAISIITFLSLLSANAQTNDNTPQHGFTWGVEVGSGIDMGGDNMSTLNLAALIGYRTSWINFAGVGLGIDMMMSNSCRSFPIYGMIRSSFAEKPKLFFAEMRAGVALNQATDVPDRTNLFLQPGAGIYLATGKTFASYITLSYTYNAMTFYGDKKDTLVHGLNMATLSLGVTF
ncbi:MULTISPECIES: hypothetical protein [Muribaculaceae]|jgi:hypothetical protein|uniref:hypothetical protein n=1 Tax=Muribaculaceae TaxID=2005473 RepID=UPI00244DCD28|nr:MULTISPECIES: hypothetical protein [Muribaculaceae]